MIEKFKYNKYFDLEDLIWFLIYTTTFSIIAGLSSYLGDIFSGNGSSAVFLLAFWNHVKLSWFINLVYSRVVRWLLTLKRPFLAINILSIKINIYFLIGHFLLGSDNPLLIVFVNMIISLILTNVQGKEEIKHIKK